MQLLICLSIFLAVITGVLSRNPAGHSSPRYRGTSFSRPQNNAISSYRPFGPNRLCRYGPHHYDCCKGWRRNKFGACGPICEKPCVHGYCSGANTCTCYSGWIGRTCSQDYNECSAQPCEHRCMNTAGSFRCYCEHGYLLLKDGRSCSRDDRCYYSRCAFGCFQSNDGFNCYCPDGLRITVDGLGCEDIDECSERTANCPRGRRCSNTYGNYLCLCQEGYKFQYVSGKLSCVDDDECAANRDKCAVDAYCENLRGGYRCVCKPGFVGTGEKCLPLGRETCEDRPCFENGKCRDIRINVTALDYESGQPARRFECAPCPPGYVGDDGIHCVASNVDVTVLVLEQFNHNPVSDVKVRAFDIRSGGATEFATAFTQLNGIAKLPVPNDARIIVVASKQGHPTTSTTYDIRNNENNLVTLTLSNHHDGVLIPLPHRTTRTFFFSDPNTPNVQLQVEVPAGALNGTEGSVDVNIRTISVSDPESFQIVPEMAALVSRDAEVGRLEAYAVAEIEMITEKTNEKVDLTEAATIRIPVSNEFSTLSVGDTVPAWYFDEAIGLWMEDGVGIIEEDTQGGLLWVYQTEHFTWWAAGNLWPGMQIVTIRTCFTEDCAIIAANTRISVWGVDYVYHASLTTDRDGSIVTFMKTEATVSIMYACSLEAFEYEITEDVTDITFKVPDTANQGCPEPGMVENGVRIGEERVYGSEITYYCNPDYEIHGNSRRLCTACGRWSGFAPYCELQIEVSSSDISFSDTTSSYDNASPSSDGGQIFTDEPVEVIGSGDGDI